MFALDGEEVYPLYVSLKEDADVINLLNLEHKENYHCCLIRNFARLLGELNDHNGASHYCYRWLHRFRREDLLEKYIPFIAENIPHRE